MSTPASSLHPLYTLARRTTLSDDTYTLLLGNIHSSLSPDNYRLREG
jgi:hypothetical protein